MNGVVRCRKECGWLEKLVGVYVCVRCLGFGKVDRYGEEKWYGEWEEERSFRKSLL